MLLQPTQQSKILMAFEDKIVNIANNEKIWANSHLIIFLLQKLKYVNFFITESYFLIPKNVNRNSFRCFTMKVSNKRQRQPTTLNHSSDIDYAGFIKI